MGFDPGFEDIQDSLEYQQGAMQQTAFFGHAQARLSEAVKNCLRQKLPGWELKA